MTAKYFIPGPIFTNRIKMRMLTGAGLGLMIIGFFLIIEGKGNHVWGNFWQVKPILLTPLGGAVVGLCYDITERLRKLGGWVGGLFFVLSILGYIVGIWMFTVLGLAGTLWD